jgi:cell division protease FtsH
MNSFDRIIGYAAEKKDLEQIADVLKNKSVYEKLGVNAPRGLLLHGEPGVGKTLMVNALIEASGRPAFLCRKDQPNGAFVNAIKSTFIKAAENAPSIVFLDDMDKFANGDERHRDSEEYVTVQSCIDKIREKDVFVLATANSLRTMPRSLLRPGRFDRILHILPPHGDDAEKIISHYLNQKKIAVDLDARTIARIMDNRSCAELETVINEAGIYAGNDRSEKITTDHFMKSCLRTIFHVSDYTLEDDDLDDEASFNETSAENSLITQIAYHEAGHAIISELLRPGSVSLIAVHRHNGHFGGFTVHDHDHSADPIKRQEMQIISSLGGRAALEQKYGIVDGGADRDLDHAFSLTRELVVNSCACGLQLHCNRYNDTQELQKNQEQVVIAEVEKYYCQAKIMIASNMPFLDKLAAALMRKGYLIPPEIQEIKRRDQDQPPPF